MYGRMRRRLVDLGIATKIVSVTFVVAAIFAAAGAVGLFKIHEITDDQDRQVRVNVAALDHMTWIQSAERAQF